MQLQNELAAKGWHLSDDYLNEILEERERMPVDQVIAKALNVDFREIAIKCLPEGLSRSKIDSIDGNIVLQINSIKNVSQPKAHEKDLSSIGGSANHVLRIHMTDGTISCQGVCLENIHNLSCDVPPGTKLYLKSDKVKLRQGFLMLNNNCCKVLGGKVQHMVDKWELGRKADKSAKSRLGGQGSNRPPPWISFGQKINSNVSIKGKALDTNMASNTSKENSEFDEQRKAVIAEALKAKEGTQKKQFASINTKQQVDQHKVAAPTNFASQEVKNNHRINTTNQGIRNDRPSTSRQNRNANSSYRSLDDQDDDIESQVSSRPSGPSTVFDFLNLKMSLDKGSSNSDEPKQQNTYPNRYERNTSLKPDNNPRNQRGSRYPERGGRSDDRFSNHESRGGHIQQRTYNKPPTLSTYPSSNHYQKQFPSLGRAQDEQKVPDENLFKENSKVTVPKKGDKIMAKYWEDNKFYPAVVHEISSNGETCVVKFLGFMNFEEVYLTDIFHASADQQNTLPNQANGPTRDVFMNQNVEFQRGGNGKQYMPKSKPRPTGQQFSQARRYKGENKGGEGRQFYVPPAQRKYPA